MKNNLHEYLSSVLRGGVATEPTQEFQAPIVAQPSAPDENKCHFLVDSSYSLCVDEII